MPHTCHAAGCNEHVPPERFMCRRHWFMLPKILQARIWASYRRGQCDDWRITHEYAEAAKDAVKWLAFKEKKDPTEALRVYDMLDPGPLS